VNAEWSRRTTSTSTACCPRCPRRTRIGSRRRNAVRQHGPWWRLTRASSQTAHPPRRRHCRWRPRRRRRPPRRWRGRARIGSASRAPSARGAPTRGEDSHAGAEQAEVAATPGPSRRRRRASCRLGRRPRARQRRNIPLRAAERVRASRDRFTRLRRGGMSGPRAKSVHQGRPRAPRTPAAARPPRPGRHRCRRCLRSFPSTCLARKAAGCPTRDKAQAPRARRPRRRRQSRRRRPRHPLGLGPQPELGTPRRRRRHPQLRWERRRPRR